MNTVDVIIIGAGQSGLAMSHELSRLGVDHLILDRGSVGGSWTKHRWDSLRLLTPNWMNTLPGDEIGQHGSDDFMTASDFAGVLKDYAARLSAPIVTGTAVDRVSMIGDRYVVDTSRGAFLARSVVVATGAAARAKLPAFADDLPGDVTSLTALQYKRPSDIPAGPVLVVGASASGQQIAAELQAAGREVTIAVGGHTRMPRQYRGRDIFFWMNKLGLLDIPWTEAGDVDRVRRTPSLSLQGQISGPWLDLNTLQDGGVNVVGRLAAIRDSQALFSGGLANACAAADLKMNRLLQSIDEATSPSPALRPEPTRLPDHPRLATRLGKGGIQTVLWATGFQPDHSWIDLPVFDNKGRLQHTGGIVSPGLCVMGLNYLRTRRSSFVSGAGSDAAALAPHVIPSRFSHIAA